MKRKILVAICLALLTVLLPLSSYADYSLGASGNMVIDIQEMLTETGNYSGSISGKYDSELVSAVKAFQKSNSITVNGIVGDATLAALYKAVQKTGTVKNGLNVRSARTTASTIKTTLSAGSKITVFDLYDSWYHIKTSGGVYGYVSKNYVTIGETASSAGQTGYVNNVRDCLNVRTGAGTKYSIITTVSNDTQLSIIATDGDWYKVSVNGTTGFCSKKYITTTAPAATTSSSSWSGTVTASTLNVRSGAGTSNKVVAQVRSGATLTVTGTSGSWYTVTLASGIKGYASKSYISAAGTKTEKPAVINVSGSLNVRKGPSTGNAVLATVKNGTKVTVLEESGSWSKIRITTGIEGYAYNKYISLSTTTAASDKATTSIPVGTFKLGKTGADVSKIQKRLKELGYFSANVTGYYGTITLEAVKSFQKTNSLTVDGICGSKSISALFSDAALKKGATSSSASESTDIGKQIAEYSKQFIGVPYVLGANGPNSFDCSGFTCYVYKHFGYTLPRTAYAQGYNSFGTKITSMSDLKVGDIICFDTVSDSDRSDHVGIYLGDGQVIHAASGSSTHKVMISSLSSTYFKTRFSWGKRVFN